MSERWTEYEEELLRKFQTQLPPEQPEQPGQNHIGLASLGDGDVVLMGVPTLRGILKANRDLYAENQSLKEQVTQRQRHGIFRALLASLCVAAGMAVRRLK